MRSLLVFGAGPLAVRLCELVLEEGARDRVALCVDPSHRDADEVDVRLASGESLRLPVHTSDGILEACPINAWDAIVAIGYAEMNAARMRKTLQLRDMGYRIASYTHPSASVQADEVGPGCIIMEHAVVGCHARVGAGNILYPAAHIAHDSVVGDFNFFSVSAVVAGRVRIGDECFLGANCTVRNDVTIASRTLVGAGAYVSSDTEEESVYVPPRSYRLEGRRSVDMHL